nr:hypothetical protein RMQUEJLB_RMQUEJLB_CDS_0004 [Microvirus sp.]
MIIIPMFRSLFFVLRIWMTLSLFCSVFGS